MADRFPSLDVVAEVVRHERDQLTEHANTLDTKASVLLGTATALAAFAATHLSVWTTPGLATALLAASICLPVFRPQRFPALRVRYLRDHFTNAEVVHTQLHLIDTEIRMAERARATLAESAARIEWSMRLLFLTVVLSVSGTMIEHFWR